MLRRVWQGLPVAVMAAMAAHAAQPLRPAEAPPADFAGRQYIDSTGCVFLRDGRRWTARMGRDGAPVCGYPPTPVGHAVLVPADAFPSSGMGRIETELVAAVTDVAPGDRGAPAASRGVLPAPAASGAGEGEGGLAEVMTAAIAASSAIGRAASGAAFDAGGNTRLCALLGMTPGSPALGGDPTGGMCSGLAAPALMPRIARAESAAMRASGEGARPSTSAATRPRIASAQPAGGASSVEHRGAPVASREAPAASAAPADHARLIPAGTRFLLVGSFGDPKAADAAVRRIAALGLPVARSRSEGEVSAILAGPFQTRQAVVRAHDRLTRAGFRGLAPRR